MNVIAFMNQKKKVRTIKKKIFRNHLSDHLNHDRQKNGLIKIISLLLNMILDQDKFNYKQWNNIFVGFGS